MQNFTKFHQFVHKILSGIKILTTTRIFNHIVNLSKLKLKTPNANLVNANAYVTFGLIPSICFQDIEWKRNSDDN